MAVASVYTENGLQLYLDAVLADVADALGWTAPSSAYTEVVNETLLAYGTDDIATVTGAANLRKLRALGRVQAWKAATGALAAHFDYGFDGASVSRSQMQKAAMAMLAQAVTDAAQYDERYAVAIDNVVYGQDPYGPLAIHERLLP